MVFLFPSRCCFHQSLHTALIELESLQLMMIGDACNMDEEEDDSEASEYHRMKIVLDEMAKSSV